MDERFDVVAVVVDTARFENLARSVELWTLLTDDPVDFEEAERLLTTLDAIKGETPED